MYVLCSSLHCLINHDDNNFDDDDYDDYDNYHSNNNKDEMITVVTGTMIKHSKNVTGSE